MQASFEILITSNETQCFLSSLRGGIKVCAVSNFIHTGRFFLEGEGDLFFLMKRDQREKRYFHKICRFLTKIKVNF